jgi:hypothetical protein
LLSGIEALLLHGETRPMTGLPARATSAASKIVEEGLRWGEANRSLWPNSEVHWEFLPAVPVLLFSRVQNKDNTTAAQLAIGTRLSWKAGLVVRHLHVVRFAIQWLDHGRGTVRGQDCGTHRYRYNQQDHSTQCKGIGTRNSKELIPQQPGQQHGAGDRHKNTQMAIFCNTAPPYNSGALLRVKALQEMNGFPEEFLLDYLDHATFRILQNKGGRISIEHAPR